MNINQGVPTARMPGVIVYPGSKLLYNRTMKPYYKISLIYLFLSALWIISSDQVVSFISPNTEVLTYLQTIKGWLFVAISTVIIFVLLQRACLKLEREEMEKKNVFKKTIEGSLHILLNYFNEMQLIRIEAEMCPDFDKAVIEQSIRFTDEAADELRRLSKLDVVDSAEIERFLNQRLQSGYDRNAPVLEPEQKD